MSYVLTFAAGWLVGAACVHWKVQLGEWAGIAAAWIRLKLRGKE